jgi:hypothetical protein
VTCEGLLTKLEGKTQQREKRQNLFSRNTGGQ